MLKSRSNRKYSPGSRAKHPKTPGKNAEFPKIEQDAIVLPRVEERLEIRKKKRPTARVQVRIVPRVRTESVELDLETEEIEVQRVPLNRVVDAPAPMRQEGDATIVPIYEEVAVVEKKLVLKEEVRITRRRKKKHETQQFPVRSEEVQIARTHSPH